MASLNQPDEQEQNQPGAPITTGGSGGAPSTSGGSGSGASVAQSPVAQNSSTQQSATPDVSSYLDANQAGSAQLGNQVASNLTSAYNTVKGGIDQSAQSAQQSAQSGYVPENTQLIQQVAASPTAAAADPNQLSAYQAQLNDTYTGPTNWADLGTQQGNVAAAQQYGGLATTPGGLNVYAQQVEGQNGGPQSQGINTLDAALLGGNPGAMSTVKAAADPYSSLNDYINAQNTAVGNSITQGQNAAQQTSQDALNAFTGANGTLTNLNSTVNNETSTAIANAKAQQATLNKDIAALYGGEALQTAPSVLGGYNGSQYQWGNTTNYNVGNLSPQDLAAMGLTQDQWNALRDQVVTAATSKVAPGRNFAAWTPTTQVDLSQWLNEQDPSNAITAATEATPQQYAEAAAVQQLLGGTLPTGTVLNPGNASEAGTAPTNPNNFDYTTALQAVQNANAQNWADTQAETNQIVGDADKAHADSQHRGGFFNSLKNAITHPGNLIGTVANPTDWISNFIDMANGKNIKPNEVMPQSKI